MEMNDGFEVWLNEPKCQKELPLKYFMGEMYPKVSTDEDKRLPLFAEDFAEYFSDLFDEKDIAVLNNELRMRFNHLNVKKKFYTKQGAFTKEWVEHIDLNTIEVSQNAETGDPTISFSFCNSWKNNWVQRTLFYDCKDLYTGRDITLFILGFDDGRVIVSDTGIVPNTYEFMRCTIVYDSVNNLWVVGKGVTYHTQYIPVSRTIPFSGIEATRGYESIGVSGLIHYTVGNEHYNEFYDVQPPAGTTTALACIYTNVDGDLYYNYKDEAPEGYRKIASWGIKFSTATNTWSEYTSPTYFDGSFTESGSITVKCDGLAHIRPSSDGCFADFFYKGSMRYYESVHCIAPDGVDECTFYIYVDPADQSISYDYTTFGHDSDLLIIQFDAVKRNNSDGDVWILKNSCEFFEPVHFEFIPASNNVSRELTLSNMEDTCIMIGAKHEDEWTMFKRIANKYNSLSADDLVKTVDIEREMENSDVESGSIDIDNTKTPNNWKETETPSGTTKSTTTNSRTPNTTDDTFYKQTKSEVDTSFNQYKTEREQTGTFDDNTTTTFNDHTHEQEGTASEKGYRGRDYGATLERAFKRRGLEWLDKVLDDIVPNLLIMCEEI